jgi:hypothetical protein
MNNTIDFPVIDTVPVGSINLGFEFESWLANLVMSLNDMFFVGKYNYAGGSANFKIPIPNVSSGQVAFAQIESSDNPVSVQKVLPFTQLTAPTSGIDVTLSGNPGESVISYVIYRI